MTNHLSILQKTFGYQEFHPIQEQVITRIIDGEDTLLILPTGGGKSLCYQFPAIISAGTCIVISPLIALMQDQVRKLQLDGVAAAMLNSSQTKKEYEKCIEQFKNNQLKLLYISPERFNTVEFHYLIKNVTISFFAIDEAHCVSEWGHDFRSDYRELKKIKQLNPANPIIALTATANTSVTQDICEQLSIPAEGVFRQSVFRKNLFIEVEKKGKNHSQKLLDFIKKNSGEQGIIYAQSRNKTEELSLFLKDNNIACLPYHARLSSEQRNKAYHAFVKEDIQVVIATIAFGMGIDKNNIRFVVHTYLPKSIESYYQEIGRAGRDGLPAHALLLFSDSDLIQHRRFANKIDNEAHRQHSLENLLIIKQYAYSEKCRHQMISEYFNDTIDECDNQCDSCHASESQRIDISKECQLFLSAIYRVKQGFGKKHIIDILSESKNQKVLQNNHHQLAVYGMGKEIPKEKWDWVYNRLYDLQAITLGDYQEIQLLPFAKKILTGEYPVSIKQKLSMDALSLIPNNRHINPDCYEALKVLRKQIADESALPAYMVFDDKTLQEIAGKVPHDEQELLAINGIGVTKLKRFGGRFLSLLIKYQPLDTPDTNITDPQELKEMASKKELHKTYRTTLELVKQKMGVEAIAQQRELAVATILSHIHKLHSENFIDATTKKMLFEGVKQTPEVIHWITEGLKLHSVEELQATLSIYRHLNE